jgi:hypothetical protein
MKDADFDLRGKDWLTEAEAAHYCGVSLTQFAKHSRQFKARRFLGKKLYSRAELVRRHRKGRALVSSGSTDDMAQHC